MAETTQKMTDKEQFYQTMLKQAEALVADEKDLIANMANIAALIRDTFHFWWVGFYRVEGEELVLGPFQGPIACTRIKYGHGVCGTAWERGETVIVPDVFAFPGHIACSAASRSEIVVPIRRNNEIIAVLDIDSSEYNTFDNTDKRYLEQISIGK